jgi:hypothetical protein
MSRRLTPPLVTSPGWNRYFPPLRLKIPLATPTGFESASKAAKDHEDSESPTVSLLQPIAKQRFTKRDGSKVAKLAILAANAVRNADLHRALELIEEMRVICEGTPAAGANLQVVR